MTKLPVLEINRNWMQAKFIGIVVLFCIQGALFITLITKQSSRNIKQKLCVSIHKVRGIENSNIDNS